MSDPRQLTNQSPLLRKMYSTTATAVSGMRGEANPLGQFAGMQKFGMNNKSGLWEGPFPKTCIGMSVNNVARVYMYHDQATTVRVGTNGKSLPMDSIVAINRDSIGISSGSVDVYDAHPFVDVNDQAVLAVGAEVNRAFRVARDSAAIQGEFWLAALFGFRGAEGMRYRVEPEMIDAGGTSLADAATGDFMDMVNDLQRVGTGSDAGAEIVRPLARISKYDDIHRLSNYNPTALDLSTIGVYGANTSLKWDLLFKAQTEIDILGNEARGPFPFRPAPISTVIADGGKRKMAKKKFPVWITGHENIQYLKEDEDWEKMQLALAQHQGVSQGLIDNNQGLYRGNLVYGFDKVPVLHSAASSPIRIAPTLCLGEGALCVSYHNNDDPGSFGMSVKPHIRTFMEAKLPVRMEFWDKPGSRGREILMAPRVLMGMIRPSFRAVKGGPKIDIGALAILTTLAARA